MNFWARIKSQVAATVGRRQLEERMESELRFHLEAYAADLMRAGVERQEAWRRARLEFGGVERVKEECRESRKANLFDSLLQDIQYGMRTLRNSPAFTVVAVLTLALGIGGNTAIFTLLDAVLLRPLPVREPQNLVILQWQSNKGPAYDEISGFGDCDAGHTPTEYWGCTYSGPMFNAIHDQQKVFAGIAGFAGPSEMVVSGYGPAKIAAAEIVTGDYFETLGIRPSAGRMIQPADDSRSAAPAIVLSYGFWQNAFGGDASTVGRTIRLNGAAFEIIGVAEPPFSGLTPGHKQDLWLARSMFPLVGSHEGWSRIDAPGNVWLAIAARLKPGVSVEQARAQATLLFRNELLRDTKLQIEEHDNPTISLLPAQEALIGQRPTFKTPLYVLMIGVGIILLICCANVAGLLIARSTARRKEMAVRLALGAGRGRIIRQLLTESVLLSVTGGGLGVLLGYWGVRVIITMLSLGPERPFPFAASPDLRILIFSAALSVATGVIFGLLPALRSTRLDLTPALKQTADNALNAERTGWFKVGNGLAALQVALAVIVLVGAGLLARTLQNLENVQPGFDTRNLLIVALDPAISGYDSLQTQRLYWDLREEFSAIPGITSVTYSSNPLLSGNLYTQDQRIAGDPTGKTLFVDKLLVGKNFFETMRIPLLAGRTFTDTDLTRFATPSQAHAVTNRKKDTEMAIEPVVVNEAFVKDYLEGRDPLGVVLKKGDGEHSSGDRTREKRKTREWEIVGVVANTKYKNIRTGVKPIVYAAARGDGIFFALRTALDPRLAIPAVREIVSAADRDLPIFEIATQTEKIERTLFQERLIARLSSFFGILALTLACIGVYGLLAYEVSRRTREIGIRVALGASRGTVMRLVLFDGLGVALAGAVIGCGVALATTRYLESFLFGIKAADPTTFLGVVGILLVIVLAACYLPARRAVRVDPLVALRYE